MLHEIGIVITKELKDFSRDKRTLKSMSGILVGLPLLYIVLVGVIQSQINEQMERTIQAGVVGCEAAPELCDFLREHRIEITPVVKYQDELVTEQSIDAVLEIPDDFTKSLLQFRSPKVDLHFDEAEHKSEFAAQRLARLLDAFQNSVSYRRLLVLGVDPALLKGITVRHKSIRPEKGFGSTSVQLFITTLLMACFMSTYHLAVDTIAGEKERNTLESLMQTATSRSAFLLGKWLTIVMVATAGTAATALVYKGLSEAGPLQYLLGNNGSFVSWSFVWGSLLLCLPIILMATALQFMIGTLSRSVKEAQTYAGLLSLLGILPASFSQILEKIPSSLWLPSLGQSQALLKLGRDQPINWLACGTASALTLVLTLGFLGVIYRHFYSEKLFRSGS